MRSLRSSGIGTSLGHGRHSKPYSGSITNENGATQLFVEQTSDLIDYFLNINEQDELIIIGHSMASDIIFRVANTNDKFIGSIGVSNYTDQIKAVSLPNCKI